MGRTRIPSRTEIGLVLCLGMLAGLVHLTNLTLEQHTEEERATGDVGPLPDGRVLRVASLGFDRVVADLFWIRTVYYMGDELSEAAGYPAAERLAQLVTDIDPEFRTVYAVMAPGLEGLANQPEAAERLLRKGIAHVAYWKLHFLLGFHYFFRVERHAEAAEQMRLAAELPGSPAYLPLLSTRLYAHAGDPETGLMFIRARLEQAETELEREQLAKRYADLWIDRDLQRIDAAIAVHRERYGVVPTSVARLVETGLLEQEPRDPRNDPYRIVDGAAVCDLPHESLTIHESYSPFKRSSGATSDDREGDVPARDDAESAGTGAPMPSSEPSSEERSSEERSSEERPSSGGEGTS